MKVTIVGGGNMGGAIARGLASGSFLTPKDITVVNRGQKKLIDLKSFCQEINTISGDYSSMIDADVVILAIKPWLIEDFLSEYKSLLSNPKQLLVSVAAKIDLTQLADWTFPEKPVFRVVPNTAVAVKKSMTFISSKNVTPDQNDVIVKMFSELGKVQVIDEGMIPAATSLASCGIAYAFRYIRAAMEGGIELGLYPDQAKEAIMQTLSGAVELLNENNSHPEQEIDKVTTAGGITIKGLNEMEHAGFTSAVIKGLKASTVK